MRKGNAIIVVLLFCTIIFSCTRSRAYESESNEFKEIANEVTIIGVPCSAYSGNDSKPKSVSLKADTGQLLIRIAYRTSYNRETRNPNWVSWVLTSEHTDGPYSRKGVPYYAEDGSVYGIGIVSASTVKNVYFLDLESEEPRQELSDWSTNYNMSHGHMCPAADNKWDKAAMNQSFLLTNMCPQDLNLNGGAWQKLEEKCREWANKYGEISIVAGPIFIGKPSRYLGHIAIPDSFFKVVLCLTGKPKAIGFIYENKSKKQTMDKTCCSVDYVEALTGYDFFEALDDNIEDSIESHFNYSDWE